MNNAWQRWRIPILFLAAQIAIIAVMYLLLGRSKSRRSLDVVGRTSPRTNAGRVEATTKTVGGAVITDIPPSTATAPKTPASVLWPEPEPIKGVGWTSDPNFGDPFESDGGRPGDVRVLTRVGAFRLGVTVESKVRNERAVKALLGQLGAELDDKDRGREDSYERRVVEYQEIVSKYRPRLKPYMDGAFAMKGNGWSLTERVILPFSRDAGTDNAD